MEKYPLKKFLALVERSCSGRLPINIVAKTASRESSPVGGYFAPSWCPHIL